MLQNTGETNMTMNDIFGDGEVLGAIVTLAVILVPMAAVMAYDWYKERKRQKILRLCNQAKEILNQIKR
jgi:hypothetical protein